VTAKSFVFDKRGNPQKLPGWFSWRHPTREAHDNAVARYQAAHGRGARRRKALERVVKSATPQTAVVAGPLPPRRAARNSGGGPD